VAVSPTAAFTPFVVCFASPAPVRFTGMSVSCVGKNVTL
jgi:hypothetical protein